ncbi:MAG: hypothetical protein AAFP03_10140 [Cyanobacteria bacterium J06598_3]
MSAPFKRVSKSLTTAISSSLFILVLTAIQLPARSQPTPSPPPTAGPSSTIAQTPQPETDAIAQQRAQLEAALATVENIGGLSTNADAHLQIKALIGIAEEFSKLGDNARSLEVLEKALTVAEGSSPNRYLHSLQSIAPYYRYINADNVLLSRLQAALQVDESLTHQERKSALSYLATGYMHVEDADALQQGLSAILNQLESVEDIGGSTRYLVRDIADSYGRLPDAAAANAGLSQLLEIALKNLEIPTPDPYGNEVFFRRGQAYVLGEVAKAYALQANTSEATTLLKQAVELLEGEDSFYIAQAVPTVAEAHGYLPNAAAAQTGLATLMDFTINHSNESQLKQLESAAAIAIAYSQIGDREQAQQTLDTAAQLVNELNEPGHQMMFLHKLAEGYKAIGNVAAQQAKIQEAFAVIDTLTPGEDIYSQALYKLSEGYSQVTDDAIAQNLFDQLETFMRQIDAPEYGRAGALGELALVAQRRGNDENAQRLLTEAVTQLSPDENLALWRQRSAIRRIITGYSHLPNAAIKQAGLEQIRALAPTLVEAESVPEIEDMIVRAYL